MNVFSADIAQDGILQESYEIIRRALELRGVDRSQIKLLEGRSSHTFGDAVALRNFVQQSLESTVAVVTSHYHTRRTRWTLRRVLGSQADRIQFVSAPVDEFTEDNWWRRVDSTLMSANTSSSPSTYCGTTAACGSVVLPSLDVWCC
jgi:uncharacterized SAM-binding protein YcdF (DUF218 family)